MVIPKLSHQALRSIAKKAVTNLGGTKERALKEAGFSLQYSRSPERMKRIMRNLEKQGAITPFRRRAASKEFKKQVVSARAKTGIEALRARQETIRQEETTRRRQLASQQRFSAFSAMEAQHQEERSRGISTPSAPRISKEPLPEAAAPTPPSFKEAKDIPFD